MGAEFLLLFGLGITGVVLTNLLAGETLTEAHPSAGAPPAEVEATPDAGRPSKREPGGGVADEDLAAPEGRVPVALPTLPHEPPHLWGHPAPLARLLALIVVSAILLCSALWGLGWFAAQAIARAVGG